LIPIKSKKKTLCDIIHNVTDDTIFIKFNLGAFGEQVFTLVKRSDNCFDIFSRNNKISQTFPSFDNSILIPNLSLGSLSLMSYYDFSLKKQVNDEDFSISICLSLFDSPKSINKKFKKLGIVYYYFNFISFEHSFDFDSIPFD
jgi:hypothetical protein